MTFFLEFQDSFQNWFYMEHDFFDRSLLFKSLLSVVLRSKLTQVLQISRVTLQIFISFVLIFSKNLDLDVLDQKCKDF